MTAVNPATSQTERLHKLGWLRVLVILFVFVYHVGLIFTGNWLISSDRTSNLWSRALGFTAFLRMPALFFAAGAGTLFLFHRYSVWLLRLEPGAALNDLLGEVRQSSMRRNPVLLARGKLVPQVQRFCGSKPFVSIE